MSRRNLRRVGVLLALLAAFFALPVSVPTAPRSSVLLDREGGLLGASVADDEQWRFPATGHVPDKYAIAVQEFEDRRFRWHPGVDPVAVLRAVVANVRAERVVSGASTITMQVVRLARDNPGRTYGEKLIEAVLALRLEASHSKDEILALYAENAPFGGNTVGIEAASWRYFGRSPAELSWAEAASLAVLPNSPALLHPGRNRDALLEKRNRLLVALREAGHLSATDCEVALAEPIPASPRPVPQKASWLMGQVDGERVQTTLDPALQAAVQAAVDQRSAELVGNGIYNAAALVVDVETGEVLAYVGNTSPRAGASTHGEQVDLIAAARSTGSLLKPFLYAAMLEDGELLPHQLVPDVPTRFGGFAPENFDHSYDGAIVASGALARSRNVPTVWMLRDYTVDRFASRLRRLGMSTLFRPASDYGLALIVGGAEGRLWDLVGMYRDLALSALHAHESVPPALRWRGGAPGPAREPAFDAGAAWLTIQALFEVNRPGVDAAWRSFAGSESIAWKTGTSFGFRDAWAIGFTPKTAIGVWVGNASGEGRPGLTGTTAAAPLLFDLFDKVHGREQFPRPDGDLVEVQVCEHSGKLAGPDCGASRTESVPRAGARGPACSFCRRVFVDAESKVRLHGGCASVSAMHAASWFVLPPAMEAFFAPRHADYKPLPPLREDCAADGEATPPMAVLSPSADASIYVPVELDGKRGAVVFQATHRDARAVIYWHLDDAFVSATTAPHQLAIAPVPGAHRLTLVDADGARVVRRFTVVDRG